MVGVVDGCMDTGQAGAHGGACELQPVSVIELEHVVSHDQFEGSHHEEDREVFRKVLLMEDQPILQCLQAMLCFDVCVHCVGIGDHHHGCCREQPKLLQS